MFIVTVEACLPTPLPRSSHIYHHGTGERRKGGGGGGVETKLGYVNGKNNFPLIIDDKLRLYRVIMS